MKTFSILICILFLFSSGSGTAEWVNPIDGIPDTSFRDIVSHNGNIIACADNGEILSWNGEGWIEIGLAYSYSDHGEAKALTMFNGDLVVCGDFTHVGDVPANNIAGWDGENWHAFGDGVDGLAAKATCLAVFEGDLIVGGDIYGNNGDGLAIWDGLEWVFPRTLGWVMCFAEFEGYLFMGRVSGAVNAWDGYNIIDQASVNSGPTAINALGAFEGKLYVGVHGSIKFMRGIGEEWEYLSSIPYFGTVISFEEYYGHFFATGSFTEIGGFPTSRIATLSNNSWHPLGAGINGLGRSILNAQGCLHVVGNFSQADGEEALGIASWVIDDPIGLQIEDVPEDQGGQLQLTWESHVQDSFDATFPIQEYVIQVFTDDWQDVSTVPANTSVEYSSIVGTDSIFVIGGPEPFELYRIEIRTSDPEQFYYSEIDSCFSIDNIAPPVPDAYLIEGDDYRYVVCSDPEILDLDQVCFYRGTESGFMPDEPVQCSQEWMFIESYIVNLYYRVQLSDIHGNLGEFCDELSLQFPSWVSESLPLAFSMEQNHPNPFNPSTTIKFSLAESGPVSLRVYDVSGKLVRDLISGQVMEAGHCEKIWNGQDESGQSVSAGIYFYKLTAGDFTDVRRMALVK